METPQKPDDFLSGITSPQVPRPDLSFSKADAKAEQVQSVEDSSEQFTGHGVPVQLTVPADLRESLKLRAYVQGVSMSELAIHYLTHAEVIQKAWVTGRKAG